MECSTLQVADPTEALLQASTRWLQSRGDGEAAAQRALAWRLTQVVALRLLEAACGVDVEAEPLEKRLAGKGPSARLWRETQTRLAVRSLELPADSEILTDDATWLSEVEQTLRPFRFSAVEGSKSDLSPEEFAPLTPAILGQMYEQLVVETAGRSRLNGAYFTPRPVVEFMCRQAFAYWLEVPPETAQALFSPAGDAEEECDKLRQLRRQVTPARRSSWETRLGRITVCDPAIGPGEFLVVAGQSLALARSRLQQSLTGTRHAAGANALAQSPSLTGIDLQPAAVALSRLRLAMSQSQGSLSGRLKSLLNQWRIATRSVKQGDSLLRDQLWPRSPDVVLGNPPYLSARHLLQQFGRTYKDRLARLYQGASGAYDLFSLFCEAALQKTSAAGVISLLVPNKLMAADYAQPARQQFADQQVLQLANLSELQVFADASVYPIIVTASKQPPTPDSQTSLVEQPSDIASLNDAVQRHHLQAACCPVGGNPWNWTEVRTTRQSGLVPLGELAEVSAGITGFSARRLLDGLIDSEQQPTPRHGVEAIPLIVTRNIDPYLVSRGSVRYLKHQFANPWLRADLRYVSAGKLELFRQPKIVIGGLGRRLEAAYVEEPLAVGVQVMCVRRWQCEPLYLLAALNSDLVTNWYRSQYGARRLSGGYLGFHCGQLSQTPIPRVSLRRQRIVARRVQQLLAALAVGEASDVDRCRRAVEQAIEQDYQGLLSTYSSSAS